MADGMTATEELRARLDELGAEHYTYDLPNGEHGVSWIDCNGIEWEAVQRGENFEIHALQLVTPEQAIAATVGAVPETKYLMALDEAREAQRKLEIFQISQIVYQSKYRSLKETNSVLRRIIYDMKATTVGTGTCHAVLDTGYYKGINGVCEGLYCSKCKEPLSRRFKHCPWCGRKIKED